jgi:membrane-associated phospholipid phosphatase
VKAAYLLLCAISALAVARVGRADVVTRWNDALLDSIRTENSHPCVASRALAVVHGAMFDVSANISGEQPFHTSEKAPGQAILAAALNSAAYTAATNLFPSRTAAFRKVYQSILSEIPASDRRARSIRFGSAVADSWIAWRAADGSSGTRVYVPSTEPGAWRRTPPFNRPPEMQNWSRVTPFALSSADQFRPGGPPALSSSEYAEELNRVQQIGGVNSAVRTAEQTEIAHFWSDFSYTVTPPGHWNQVAQSIAANKHFSLAERVRLFAVLNITLADVGIACWDSKYAFNFWRPVTAIRAADRDSNANTNADTSWMPLLNTPAFPEFVSGHSAFSAAAAVVLTHFNSGDSVSFSVVSDSLPDKSRSFGSFWGCAEEVSQSRLYGGIHFPSSLAGGLTLGKDIGIHILASKFQAYFPTLPTDRHTAKSSR